VVIDDFHIVGTIVSPHETDPPLIVDTDAVPPDLLARIPSDCQEEPEDPPSAKTPPVE
jgi:hypothetical protein